MEPLIIEATSDTPSIKLEEGTIEIKGRAIPEHVNKLFDPVMDWVKEYLENSESKHTTVNISLEYANSCTFKYLSNIFCKLDIAFKQGHKVIINWEYEEDDESIYSIGEDIQSIINIPFNFKSIDHQKDRQDKIIIKNRKTGVISKITQRYWEAIVRNGHESEYENLGKEE